MTTAVTLNPSVISDIAFANDTALAITEELKARRRNRTFIDLNRTHKQLSSKGTVIDYNDYVAYWKSLEAAGAGRVVVGRKGNPTIFKWNLSLREVANAALSPSPNHAELPALPKEKRAPRKKKTSNNDKAQPKRKYVRKSLSFKDKSQRILSFKLRPDVNFDIVVPAGLTRGDLAQVAKTLTTLKIVS